MAIVVLAAALFQAAPSPPAPPPPPPIIVGADMPRPGPPPQPTLVDYRLAEVRCQGSLEQPVQPVQLLPTSTFLSDGQSVAPHQLAFRIAADGRPLGISEPNRVEGGRLAYVNVADLAPALAATRFAAGAERRGCVATYAPVVTPVASAPRALLHRYLALPRTGGVAWQPAVKRVQEEAPGCFKPRPPRALLQGYPDFDAIPQPPGTLAFTMVGFDIGADGVPVNVRTLSSDGNAALDAAGVAAIARSRFAAEPRTGCSFPFYRRQANSLAPPEPPAALTTFKKRGDTCDDAVPWAKLPPLVFPEAFRRRAIEGWAVVRYDVAPWGGTGNIEVVASEPAAAFGEAAKRVIAGASRPPSTAGATGCVDRVRFKLADAGEEPNASPPPY